MSRNNGLDQRDSKSGQFVMGHSGYGGRPKGSRNKLTTEFLDDLHTAWIKHGSDVIERVIKDDPAQFLKTVAAVLPRELDQTLHVDMNLSVIAEARSFDEAFRFALRHIGSEIEVAREPELIEADDAAE